jgi:uncharacterized protein
MSAPRAHKNAACGYCAFRPECIEVWEQQGDLSLVAGIGAQTVEVYERVGIGDMDGLAAADEEAPPADVGPQAWRTHIRQSRLQARARREPTIPFEVLDGNVLRTLTPPSPGDIYFDIEGYAIPPIRLEYLFGMWDGAFTALWAHTAEEEARMLSAFIAYVSERRAVHPDLRIYYYNHYEVNALRRLADTYRIHQQEVEELCSQVMVNLMPIVKQSIMAGLPGYGLKELERLHGFERNSEVKTAGDSVDLYDRWLYDGNDPQLLEDIAAYNLEDLLSTQALHRWLAALA